MPRFGTGPPDTPPAVAPADGNVTVTHSLTGDCGCTPPVLGEHLALVYQSRTVAVHPVVEATLASDPGGAVPTQIQVRLTWAGGSPQSWVDFATTGHSAGGPG